MHKSMLTATIVIVLTSLATAQTSGCIAQSGNCAPPPPCIAFDQEPRCVAGRQDENTRHERERAIDKLLRQSEQRPGK